MHHHDGHFERLTTKFRSDTHGGTLEDHEIIELLLHFVQTRVNTNEQAHELIDSSGGFCEMFNRSEESLCRIDGVGPRSALLMRITGEVIRRYMLELCDTSKMLKEPEELHNYLKAHYVGAYTETACMLMFNKNGKFLGCENIGKGVRSEGEISMKLAVTTAHKNGATTVVIAHNHPDGIAYCSDMDIETSRKLDIGFGNAGMRVHEHFIVAGGKCVPFSDKIKTQR